MFFHVLVQVNVNVNAKSIGSHGLFFVLINLCLFLQMNRGFLKRRYNVSSEKDEIKAVESLLKIVTVQQIPQVSESG